jgi:hypothetical protein
MTYQVFCQSFAPGSWKWTGKEPAGLGMQLDAAFRAFAALVNALPDNASTPLSVVRSHADATANRWGYTWQLGHPVEPVHLWFHTESITAQGDTQSSSSAVFGQALASGFANTTANGGYGSHGGALVFTTGLAYVDSISAYNTVGAILLIAQDTTPGKEFFCWALKTHGGNEDLHRDSCHALYKSPGTTGWNSIAIFPRTSRHSYGGQVLPHGYSGNRFGTLPSAIGSSLHANGHQLRSGIALGHFDSVLQGQGLFESPPPLIQLPAPLFIGATSTRGASTHFGRVSRPDGQMLQLGQRSSERDVWLWVPAGTSHSQSSPWSSALVLSHWRESNELHFIRSLPPQSLQLIIGTADFIRHFPPMSAMGTRQHPQQGPLLSSRGGGGGGGGEGDGGGSGGTTRPATGLLWPRGV